MLTETPIFWAVLPMAKKILINMKPRKTVYGNQSIAQNDVLKQHQKHPQNYPKWHRPNN
jgi:hypothetical protein